MAVNNTKTKEVYVGRGDSGPYVVPTDLPVLIDPLTGNAKDIRVYVRTPLDVQLDITDDCNFNGRNVYTPLESYTSDYTIHLIRETPELQETDFPEDVPYAQAAEDSIDKLTYIAAEVRDTVDRSLRLQKTDPAAQLTLPSASQRANRYVRFDQDGNLGAGEESPPRGWSPIFEYTESGFVIQYSGKLYKLVAAPDLGTEPGTDNTVWEPIPFSNQWDPNILYEQDKIVEHQGAIYSLISGTDRGTEPGTDDTVWEPVPRTLEWISGHTYSDGDYAQYNGKLYRSTSNSNKGNPPGGYGNPDWEVALFGQQWDDEYTYQANQIVQRNGHFYRSSASTQNEDPETNYGPGEPWDFVPLNLQWDPEVQYYVGDGVVRSGILYTCIADSLGDDPGSAGGDSYWDVVITQLADDVILSSDDIGENVVTDFQIADNAVKTLQIDAGAVKNAQINTGAVDTNELAAGAKIDNAGDADTVDGRTIHVSDSGPSGGNDGDLWFEY